MEQTDKRFTELLKTVVRLAASKRTHKMANALRAKEIAALKREIEARDRIQEDQTQLIMHLRDRIKTYKRRCLPPSLEISDEEEEKGKIQKNVVDIDEEEAQRSRIWTYGGGWQDAYEDEIEGGGGEAIDDVFFPATPTQPEKKEGEEGELPPTPKKTRVK